MATKKNDKKKTTILIIGFLVLLSPLIFACGIAIFTWGVLVMDGITETVTWREHTIPLGQEVVDDLCNKFELDANDERCDNSGDEVFGPDFFNELHTQIASDKGDWKTYEKVNEKLGLYEFKREAIVTQPNDKDYFVCHYDFAGDRVYSFLIFYYTDGEIMRVIADVVD